jgi:hypothetical protein
MKRCIVRKPAGGIQDPAPRVAGFTKRLRSVRSGAGREGWHLCAVVAVCVLASATAQAAERYVGLAYARATDRLVYREVHWRLAEAGVAERLVLYECANGSPFARKQLRELTSTVAPDFDFEDGRDGYREGVHTSGSKREVYVRKSRQAALQEQTLPAAQGQVIDAGFDAYVRGHWRELSSGAELAVPFLVPSRFAYLEFKFSNLRDGMLGAQSVSRLHMRLTAWYGFAFSGIELTYDRDGQRLVQFEGPATIRGVDGRNEDVRIVFPAGELIEDVPDAEAAQARIVPLVSSCADDGGATS